MAEDQIDSNFNLLETSKENSNDNCAKLPRRVRFSFSPDEGNEIKE